MRSFKFFLLSSLIISCFSPIDTNASAIDEVPPTHKNTLPVFDEDDFIAFGFIPGQDRYHLDEDE
jgi:hypothetical protein